MWLIIVMLLMLAECAAFHLPDARYSCVLTTSHHQSTYKEGDVFIGGILQQSSISDSFLEHYIYSRNVRWLCLTRNLRFLRQYMAFIYAIEEINRSPEILPNLTLGYEIYDSCFSASKSLQGTMSILSKKVKPVPNYSCQRKDTLIGIIGDLSSVTSHAIYQLTGIYKYPQVSYGAQDPIFSDKSRFASFYRTVPNEVSQFAGIAQLLKYFGWTWVGMLTSDDDSGERALRELTKDISSNGGCIEFSYTLPSDNNDHNLKMLDDIAQHIANNTAHVIIVYSIGISAIPYLLENVLCEIPHKIWILSVALSFISYFVEFDTLQLLNGTLIFLIENGDIFGFPKFLFGVKPSKFPDDMMLQSVWQEMFKCRLPNQDPTYPRLTSIYSPCTGNETLKSFGSVAFDVSNFRFTYRLYIAVHVLAYALHDMLSSDIRQANSYSRWSKGQDVHPWKVQLFCLQNKYF